MPHRLVPLLFLVVSFAARAQNSAITINPGSECQGLFKSVWLSIDGQMEAAVTGGSPNRAENVPPGTHEVTVNCVEGFTARVLLTQDITFPAGTELRMRLKGKTLELVGKGAWAPPVVARRPAIEDPPRRRVRDEDDDDRRSRRRGDDDDDRPRRRRARDDDDEPRRRGRRDDDAQRILRLTNHHGASVVRFSWRKPGEPRFREVRLPYVVGANEFQDVSVPDGTIGACVETADGFFLYWERVQADQNLVIESHEQNWARGSCN